VCLVSGRGSNLQSLLNAFALPTSLAEIVGVVSNRPDAFALQRATIAQVDTVTVDHNRFSNREDFDAELASVVSEFKPDLVVLAGFMRILGHTFVDQYHNIFNIHPSLLPAFPGLDTHRRAIEAGVTHHGASVHYVTTKLDAGPIIIQGRVPVLPDDNESRLAARVLDQEHRIYPTAIKWFAEGRLSIANDQVHVDGCPVQTLR